jgi:hypothetical protein
LIGLLVFYIFSIELARASALGVPAEAVFMVGNIVVEALLLLSWLKTEKRNRKIHDAFCKHQRLFV